MLVPTQSPSSSKTSIIAPVKQVLFLIPAHCTPPWVYGHLSTESMLAALWSPHCREHN